MAEKSEGLLCSDILTELWKLLPACTVSAVAADSRHLCMIMRFKPCGAQLLYTTFRYEKFVKTKEDEKLQLKFWRALQTGRLI